MFSWLVTAGYLAGNPLSLSRQRNRKAKPRIMHTLPRRHAVGEVRAAIEAMPRESSRDREHYHRVRWIFSLLIGCGLRISELAGATMGNFECSRDGTGNVRWWLLRTHQGRKSLSMFFERLLKLKPKSRSALLSSIGTMFQFQGGISDDKDSIVLELQKQGRIAMDSNERVTFPA